MHRLDFFEQALYCFLAGHSVAFSALKGFVTILGHGLILNTGDPRGWGLSRPELLSLPRRLSEGRFCPHRTSQGPDRLRLKAGVQETVTWATFGQITSGRPAQNPWLRLTHVNLSAIILSVAQQWLRQF